MVGDPPPGTLWNDATGSWYYPTFSGLAPIHFEGEIVALRAERDAYKAVLEKILEGAQNQGAFTGMSWKQVEDMIAAVLKESK